MSWSTELRKGILELCVLAILDREECYGYELVQRLQAYGELLAGEGTIYPLLARLQRQGLVETSWRESHSGPPRKYYRLSEAGHQLLLELVDEWQSLRDSVDKLLGFAHRIK